VFYANFEPDSESRASTTTLLLSERRRVAPAFVNLY
jgi:hypothetical protein